MGDIEEQTAVEPLGDGRFTAMVHADWEIWGPCGGYVAALALRAAGAESPFARPASFFCHYLSVAAFAPVDLEVTPLRSGPHRAGAAGRHDPGGPARARRHGLVGRARSRAWSTRTSALRMCPIPRRCRLRANLAPDENRPAMPFWDNFDQRPIDWSQQWPPPGPLAPTWRTWVRCRPTATFADPWVDAARSLIVLDVGSWPAGSRPHMYQDAAVHRAEPRPLRLVPVPGGGVGVAAARRTFAGRARRPAVVDRQGVVTRAPPHRQRRAVRRSSGTCRTPGRSP